MVDPFFAGAAVLAALTGLAGLGTLPTLAGVAAAPGFASLPASAGLPTLAGLPTFAALPSLTDLVSLEAFAALGAFGSDFACVPTGFFGMGAGLALGLLVAMDAFLATGFFEDCAALVICLARSGAFLIAAFETGFLAIGASKLVDAAQTGGACPGRHKNCFLTVLGETSKALNYSIIRSKS